jgi:hypothetical protein
VVLVTEASHLDWINEVGDAVTVRASLAQLPAASSTGGSG